MSIIVHNLSKSYNNQKALQDVSLEITQGGVTGFLGPNGAGKSSLLRILNGLIEPDAGTARVAGIEVVPGDLELNRKIGFLPENNPLPDHMYVREYLAYHARLYSIDLSRVEEVIEDTGLEPQAHQPITALSKGYRQRTGLAAALLHDPEVLLLDEPTTGLDPNQMVEIRKLIQRLGKTKTVLLSTHILSEVEAMCDAVVILHHGRVVAHKTMTALRSGDKQLIDVEFDYRVEPELVNRIQDVREVHGAGFNFTLIFHTQEDRRSAVFDFAHDNGLKILTLNKRNLGLESLFRELTSVAASEMEA